MIATKNWQVNIPRAPQINSGRRPNLSTVQKERGVEQTLTNVKIREIKKVLLIAPVDCKNGVE
jgi:hypothetical protein